MEYNEKRKKVILKKINDFNFQKLNNVEDLLKKEISSINPIINETRTLLFHNTEFSDWYISKSESLVLQLEQGNKEPYLFCFVSKQVINNTFFGTKKINKLFYERYSVGSIKREKQVILNSFLNLTKNERDFLDYLSSLDKMVDESIQKEYSEKISQKQKKVKEIKTNILNEFDKDGNGIIDVIEGGDDFMKLFRKHQTLIKDFDKNYINHLVKISNYLKTKRNNIQDIFLEIRKTKNQLQLDENLGLLKNQIHTYEVVLFHSLSMITSIVEDDLITVNEIYEEFDKLKMFKTDHEKEVSQKLSDIGNGLSNLMYSINTMERNILSGLNTLSYVTQEGFVDLNRSLTKELKSINSTIDSGNLLSLISTYQLYKINKQTKGLIE